MPRMTDLVGPPVPEPRRPTEGHSLAEAVVETMAEPPGDELRSYQCTPGPSDPPRSDPVYDAGSYVLDSEDHLADKLDFARVTDPSNPNVRYALYLVTNSFICHQSYPEIPAY